jgi:hypothetical protein
MKTRPIFNSRFAYAVVIMVLLSAGVFGQKAKIKTPSTTELNDIYDEIFPRATTMFRPSEDAFALDVRIERSWNSPSQISIVQKRNNTLQVVRYDLANEEKSLFEQLVALPNYSETTDFINLARQLKVNRQNVKSEIIVRKLLDRFFLNNKLRKETNYSLDGTMYKVWYADSGSSLQFQQLGSDHYEKGESSLITFVRTLINEVHE